MKQYFTYSAKSTLLVLNPYIHTYQLQIVGCLVSNHEDASSAYLYMELCGSLCKGEYSLADAMDQNWLSNLNQWKHLNMWKDGPRQNHLCPCVCVHAGTCIHTHVYVLNSNVPKHLYCPLDVFVQIFYLQLCFFFRILISTNYNINISSSRGKQSFKPP